MRLVRGLSRQPVWIQLWVGWLVVVNLVSLGFIGRPGAEWVLYAFIGASFGMIVLAEINGYNRLLGMGHVVFWTPLLIYLVGWRWEPLTGGGFYGWWLVALTASNAISLVVDYLDVFRYAAGDRAETA